jgi:shikimate kinase/3-dehydroquinate synthase
MQKIFLYGPSGSGKSTVGKTLAEQLEAGFVDIDTEIERTAGIFIPQIMSEQGEPAFRDLEAAELQKAIQSGAGVVSLGGGALLRASNRELAEAAGVVVYLDADVDTLVGRLRNDPSNPRPLLAGELREKLAGLLERRADHYNSFDLRIATKELTPEEIGWQIQRLIGHFRVSGMGAPYDVLCQAGALDDLSNLLRERGLTGPLALVADSNVAPLYGQDLLSSLQGAGFEASLLTIPAGEQHKSLETVYALWRDLLAAGLDRKSTLVALGGGVTTDLAGFAAATYMRGIPWVAVPTSLLGMVDASVGGKTGFDLPEGKNLVGSFHPPRLVLADPEVLSTLPERELRCGLAEAVKSGIIDDPDLFELCTVSFDQIGPRLEELVRRSMAVKAKVITIDPYERGIRAALNLGHTFGHAVESVSNFELGHGEAIAIGMVVEARLAERLGLATAGLSEEIGVTLSDLGLPTAIPSDLSREAIIQTMRLDKKKSSGVVRFALPVAIGKVEIGVEVEDLQLVFED